MIPTDVVQVNAQHNVWSYHNSKEANKDQDWKMYQETVPSPNNWPNYHQIKCTLGAHEPDKGHHKLPLVCYKVSSSMAPCYGPDYPLEFPKNARRLLVKGAVNSWRSQHWNSWNPRIYWWALMFFQFKNLQLQTMVNVEEELIYFTSFTIFFFH